MDRLDLLKLSPYLEDQFTGAIATATHDSVYDLCLKESMDCCEWLTDDMEMALIRSAAQACVKFAEAETAKLRADLRAALAALQDLVNYDNGGSGDGGAILDAAEKTLASHKENLRPLRRGA